MGFFNLDLYMYQVLCLSVLHGENKHKYNLRVVYSEIQSFTALLKLSPWLIGFEGVSIYMALKTMTKTQLWSLVHKL